MHSIEELCSHQDRIINSVMRYLFFVILLLGITFKVSAYEMLNPFNIELGKEFSTDLNYSERIRCGRYSLWTNSLNSVDFEHSCLVIETRNPEFPIANVFINKNTEVTNYQINDVLAVSIFEEAFSRDECHQFVKDMRNKLIKNHGYKSITKEVEGEDLTYDTSLEIMKEKNTFNDHSWWEGIYKNLGVHVMCGHSESIAVEWVLTDIKLKGISTDF